MYIDIRTLMKNSKYNMNPLLIALSMISIIVLAPVAAISKTYAAPPSTTITLSTVSSVVQGSTINVGIYTDSVDPIFGGDVYVSYPAASFSYVGVVNSPDFSIDAGNTSTSGVVQLSKANFTSLTGVHLFATLQLKATGSSGTATIGLTNATKIAGPDYPSVNYFSGNPTVAIALKSATTTPPPYTPVTSTPTPTKTTTTTPKPTVTPKPVLPLVVVPSEDKTPPVISDVFVSDITTGSATISWKTSEPATSQVSYGTTSKYGISAGNTTLVTTHEIKLESASLSPGTDFQFLIQSMDAAGNIAKSDNQTFHTKGGTITVTVLDKVKRPLKNAKVAFGSINGTTDDKGQVTLHGMPLGNVKGVVTHKGKKTNITVAIAAFDANGLAPGATLTAETSSSSPMIVLLVGLLAVAAGVVIWARKPLLNLGTAHNAPVNNIVVGGTGTSKTPAVSNDTGGSAVVSGASKGVTGITTPKSSSTNVGQSSGAGSVVKPTNSSSNDTPDKL
jgi:hypothetical protein